MSEKNIVREVESEYGVNLMKVCTGFYESEDSLPNSPERLRLFIFSNGTYKMSVAKPGKIGEPA